MAGLYHPHIVRLLGYCDEYNREENLVEQLLVYEFVPNGDLEAFLGNRKQRSYRDLLCKHVLEARWSQVKFCPLVARRSHAVFAALSPVSSLS